MNNDEQIEACAMTQHTRSHEEKAEFLTTCSIIICIHMEELSPFKIGVINSLGSINQRSYHLGNYIPPNTPNLHRGKEFKILTSGLEKKEQSKQAHLPYIFP